MGLLVLSLLLLSLAFYSLYYVLFKPKTTAQSLPPGAKGWPLIGETLEYHALSKKGCIEKFMSDRMKKYSSKIFKTSYLGADMVFLCSAEGNKFLFSNDYKLFKPWLPSIIEKSFKSSPTVTLQEEFNSLRRVIAAFTGPNALRRYVGIMDENAKTHLQKYWDGNDSVKVHDLSRKFIFALCCELMYNIHHTQTADELESLAHCIMTEFFIIPVNIPGTKFGRAVRAGRELHQRFLNIIKQRRLEIEETREPEHRDILSLLFLEKNKDGQDLTESEIALKMQSILIGAYDNPSIAISTIIKFLAELPEIYEQVFKEQVEIANSKGPEELLTFDDLKRMKYTWNVISEVLRMEPPNSGTFRETLKDVTINGYTIPKGFKLHWAVNTTHRDPECFPNPEKFEPSRYEGNDLVPFSYVPFGAGPHICPGKEFARLKLLVFFHNLVRKFRWEKIITDEKMIRNPNLMPEKGLPVLLCPNKI